MELETTRIFVDLWFRFKGNALNIYIVALLALSSTWLDLQISELATDSDPAVARTFLKRNS